MTGLVISVGASLAIMGAAWADSTIRHARRAAQQSAHNSPIGN